MLDPCSMFLPVGVGVTTDVPKYAKGVTYSAAPAYLPGFGPGAGAEPAKTNWWAWALGALAVGGMAWIVSSGAGALAANPSASQEVYQISARWADSGRMRLLATLPRRRAYEYVDRLFRSGSPPREVAVASVRTRQSEVFTKETWRENPVNPSDAGPPYTLEELNSLIGTRVHTSASPHATLESATGAAKLRASRVRKFVTLNVLDRRGGVVATFQGVH